MATTFTAPEPIPSNPDKVPAPNIRLNPVGTLRTLYCRIPSGVGKLPLSRKRVASGSGTSLAGGLARGLRARNAEYNSIRPKIMAIALVGTLVARNAPNSAPKVVAISRNIPILMLENPSFTYAAAAPEEVALPDPSDAPMA